MKTAPLQQPPGIRCVQRKIIVFGFACIPNQNGEIKQAFFKPARKKAATRKCRQKNLQEEPGNAAARLNSSAFINTKDFCAAADLISVQGNIDPEKSGIQGAVLCGMPPDSSA